MEGSIHSPAASKVSISARRFEQSPYVNCYANDQSVLGVIAGRFYEVFSGEDVVATYWKLRRQVVLYDVPEKPWQIEGPDAVTLLEKVFARRVGNLPEGRGRYAIACTPNGGTFTDGILFRHSRDVFWYVQPEGAVEAWLLAMSGGLDVKISDPKSRVLQIQGPNSFKMMADLTKGAITEELKYFQSGFYDIGGQRMFVSRTGWTGELGYEVYSVGATTNHEKLFDDLMEAGAAHGLVYASMASMEVRRLEAGILDNISDFNHTMTPFACGLGAFIDLEKEGYVGRKALQTADRRTRLLGLTCQDGTPEYGGKVSYGERPVGFVTAATWSPTLSCGIAYVCFDEAGDWLGKTVSVNSAEGAPLRAQVAELPFYDKEKRIPRAIVAAPV